MKNRYLFVLIIAFTTSGFSQKITIDEVMNLRKGTILTVEEQLLSNDWNYMSGQEEKDDEYGSASFGYGTIKNTNSTASIISLRYSKSSEVSCVNYQITDKQKYSAAIERLKLLGCKLLKSQVINGNMVNLYRGLTTSIEVEISQEQYAKSGLIFYSFLITDNDYYQRHFRNRFN